MVMNIFTRSWPFVLQLIWLIKAAHTKPLEVCTRAIHASIQTASVTKNYVCTVYVYKNVLDPQLMKVPCIATANLLFFLATLEGCCKAAVT
jgi:hypothetical protein